MGIFDELFIPHSSNNGTGEVELLANKAIPLYEQGDIPALQNKLYESYQHFNKRGGGRSIPPNPTRTVYASFRSEDNRVILNTM